VVQRRVKGRRGLGEREGEEREGEEEMAIQEVERAIRKLKKGKAAREDGIQNEAGLWGGQGVRKAIGEIFRRVWGGGGFPERWKEGIIVPIAKKRGRKGWRNIEG